MILVRPKAGSRRVRRPRIDHLKPTELEEVPRIAGEETTHAIGAQRGGKPGLLELANQGTVFLDEIGEMSPYLEWRRTKTIGRGDPGCDFCFARATQENK